jgi:hypothetical protein
MAPVPALTTVEDGDGAFVVRIGDDLQLGAEAANEEALEARFEGVARRFLAGGEVAPGGVDPVDEVEQLGRRDLHATGEDFVGIEGLAAPGHAPSKVAPCDAGIQAHTRRRVRGCDMRTLLPILCLSLLGLSLSACAAPIQNGGVVVRPGVEARLDAMCRYRSGSPQEVCAGDGE